MLLEEIIGLFYEHANPDKAASMASYMKNQFPFLGISKPDRSRLQREFVKQERLNKAVDWNLVFALWNMPEREFQYLAMDYLLALRKYMQKDDISYIKTLIVTKSWWDTVDMLASGVLGALCLAEPDLVSTHMLEWSDSDNKWLRRSAILFQLKYKQDTDPNLLSAIIANNLGTREFFINKAIGWILREYSKTDRDWVKTFINSNTLHPLSVREASKYL